jgi:NADH dehydrogenase FAD-containing subunit
VILGGGFGGLYTALALEKTLGREADVEVTLVNRENFFLFTPMLHEVAAIGRRTGVANIMGINFSGIVAWWLWRTIYLSKLPRLEKKVRVLLEWTLDLFFSKDLVQFMTYRAPTASQADDEQAAVSPRSGKDLKSR